MSGRQFLAHPHPFVTQPPPPSSPQSSTAWCGPSGLAALSTRGNSSKGKGVGSRADRLVNTGCNDWHRHFTEIAFNRKREEPLFSLLALLTCSDYIIASSCTSFPSPAPSSGPVCQSSAPSFSARSKMDRQRATNWLGVVAREGERNQCPCRD